MLAARMERKAEDWKARLKSLGLARRRAAPSTLPTPPAAPRPSLLRGRRGEDAAARFLEQRGVRVVARNVRYPDGELDLVGEEGELLLFVEVKSRATALRGAPQEAVTPRKRRRVLHAARRWLASHPPRGERAVRFDVIAIQEEPYSMEWIRGAFDASAAT